MSISLLDKNKNNKYIEEDKNKIELKDENKLSIKKKKKKKKKVTNEKVFLFENNDIVEYDLKNISKNNKIVLDEETYVSTLENIIERKYYPDIAKYKSEYIINDKNEEENEFMNNDLTSNKNFNNLKDTNLCNFNNILNTPNEIILNENIKNYEIIELPNGKKHKINLNMSLCDFQKRYTSEDNRSFEYLLNKIKNEKIEKNIYCIKKREKHNKLMDKIDDYTKKGVNCNMINSGKAEKEDDVIMFRSSNLKRKLNDEIKSKKIEVFNNNTRFSEDDKAYIKMLIDQSDENKKKKILQKLNETKINMIFERNMNQKSNEFDEFSEINNYSLIKTNDENKENDKNKINEKIKTDMFTWGRIANTPLLIENSYEKKNEKKNEKNIINIENINNSDSDIYRNEFSLQKKNKREIIAEELQNKLKKNICKNNLKKKHLKSLINKNYSSRMSISSFKNSILSRHSQIRLNELVKKSKFASEILKKK